MQPAETMWDGYSTEMGLINPNRYGFRIKRVGGYLLHACPVSLDNPKRTILGIWPILYVSHEQAAQLTTDFVPTREVREIGWMTPDEISRRKSAEFRFNLKPWLMDGFENDRFSYAVQDTTSLTLLPPDSLDKSADMDFHESAQRQTAAG